MLAGECTTDALPRFKGQNAMKDPCTFVIVGAGLAGAKAAQTLRDEGFDDDVVLLGEEPCGSPGATTPDGRADPGRDPPASRGPRRGGAAHAKRLIES